MLFDRWGMWLGCLAVSCFFGLAAPGIALETLTLKGGYSLRGEVLKERSNELIVDVGVDILRVPVSQILSRRQSSEEAPVNPKPEQDSGGFYSVSNLPPSTVRDLAAQFGEAAVLIRTPGGLGSGFIINQKGYCVTNHHVIDGETEITVTIFRQKDDDFQKMQIENVKIVALNPFFDLALLKLPPQKNYQFQSVVLAGTDGGRVGDTVFAIGNPLGLERTVSQGIISANRNGAGKLFLQTTAQINPGNSGGPLFNLRGQVVGVPSLKRVDAEGLGFAIPVRYVKHFLDNRDAFAYDRNNPNAGYRYLDPPRRRNAREKSVSSSSSQEPGQNQQPEQPSAQNSSADQQSPTSAQTQP